MTARIIQGNALALPLPDESVDLVVTSPPYFSLRSYRDNGEHYLGQIGSEETPKGFLEALWAVTGELKRVLKPSGSIFVNLGDKYAGSGGHNNSNLAPDSHGTKVCPQCGYEANRKRCNKCDTSMKWPKATTDPATRRNAPDRYNQDMGGVRAKSLMGLPWMYANGCTGALAALGGPDPGLNLILRAEILWDKVNSMPESVTDRVRRNHEQWFHMVKQPHYFSGVDEIREPHTSPLHSPGQLKITDDRNDGDRNERVFGHELGKLPSSVWTISSEPLVIPETIQKHYNLPDHFAAFPQEFPRRMILGWSPTGICTECNEGRTPISEKGEPELRAWSPAGADYVGGDQHGSTLKHAVPRTITGYTCACPEPSAPTRNSVVLDPFAGTGTTVGVANALGRDGIGIELSADYCRLAEWRINESQHFAKTISRTNKERQGALFGDTT